METITKITILGKEYFYRIKCKEFQSDEWNWTEFFTDYKSHMRKRFYFFGKPILIIEPTEILFRVEFNIESITKTKSDVRIQLEHAVKLLTRKEEIERGEII
jgi:hypothetical protein